MTNEAVEKCNVIIYVFIYLFVCLFGKYYLNAVKYSCKYTPPKWNSCSKLQAHSIEGRNENPEYSKREKRELEERAELFKPR